MIANFKETNNPEIKFQINRSIKEGVMDIDTDIFPNHFTVSFNKKKF
jgi:hypothetical protein